MPLAADLAAIAGRSRARAAAGRYLIVEDEELEAIEIETTHVIEINRFVPRLQIDQALKFELLLNESGPCLASSRGTRAYEPRSWSTPFQRRRVPRSERCPSGLKKPRSRQ
jgi:hypothetical protein